ncbi:MAG: amidophosphoribosyltransferase, partial [Thermomicrobiales bacterium]
MEVELLTPDADLDKPHEECGVFGIYAPGEDVARITFFGLYALQHRGQESAGIATSNGAQIFRRTHLGLVSQAFNEADLGALPGMAAIGHTRYSTTGQSNERNAGPMLTVGPLGPVAIAHNGNIVNAYAIKEALEAEGETFETTTDSEVLTRLIALSPGQTMIEKIRTATPTLIGAFSLAILTPEAVYAVRDPKGVRPLCLGKLGDHWIVASESCALMTVGAEFVREVE